MIQYYAPATLDIVMGSWVAAGEMPAGSRKVAWEEEEERYIIDVPEGSVVPPEWTKV
jgi:hypothetical protein